MFYRKDAKKRGNAAGMLYRKDARTRGNAEGMICRKDAKKRGNAKNDLEPTLNPKLQTLNSNLEFVN